MEARISPGAARPHPPLPVAIPHVRRILFSRPARCLWPLVLVALCVCSMGASARSRNFVVDCGDAALARQIAQTAEALRRDLAVAWLGKAMPDWSAPCVMTVRVGSRLGAGGQTTFMFDRGEVIGWRMSIQGSRERILDSVLPHEITHMIFASHFRRPLPRWADEGAATSTECSAERDKYYRMLKEFLSTRRGIPFDRMLAMTEYPADVMPLYAQGFSLVDYLIEQGGRRKFVAFLEDALQDDDWPAAFQHHYGQPNLGRLQNEWVAWVRQGHPPLSTAGGRDAVGDGPSKILLASAAGTPAARAASAAVPTRSVRPPGQRLATAGDRVRPLVDLIYRIPRQSSSSGIALASASAPSRATVAEEDMLPSAPLVAVVYPAARGADSTAAWPPPTQPATVVSPPTAAQLARPQPVEQARQIILEWMKPTPSARD